MNLLISVLSLKVAIIGCGACTPEQKEAFMVTATSIEQTIQAELAKPQVEATTTPIIVYVQPTPAAPTPTAPVVVDTPPPPPPSPTFLTMPRFTTSPSTDGVRVRYFWQSSASTTAAVSLCPVQWTCIVQGTTMDDTYTIERPAGGVEWVEIRLSDTVYYRAQRPQL